MVIKKEALKKLINSHKLRILEELQKKDKMTQTALSKKINLSERQTRRYVGDLKKAGLVKTRQAKRKKGKPRFVSLR